MFLGIIIIIKKDKMMSEHLNTILLLLLLLLLLYISIYNLYVSYIFVMIYVMMVYTVMFSLPIKCCSCSSCSRHHSKFNLYDNELERVGTSAPLFFHIR